MSVLQMRVWKEEVAKDRTALEIYADRTNWKQTKEGMWVFIGPNDGPTVADRALSTCLPGKSALPRGTRMIRRRLTRA